MFVLLRLIFSCLERQLAQPALGDRPLLPSLQTRRTGHLAALAHTLFLAPIHAPMSRLSP